MKSAKPPVPNEASAGWLLLMASVIISIGVIKFFYTRPKPTATSPKSTISTAEVKWTKVFSPNAKFFSKIFMDRSHTFVTIPIKFDDNNPFAWLTLDSSTSAKPYSWLIRHPQLEKLTWKHISDGTVHLYQKNNTYTSMSDFINRPPSADKLLIESRLQKIDTYRSLKAKTLDQTFDEAAIDYILTTYIPLVTRDGATYYENKVDATYGLVDKNQALTWWLDVPNASSTSAYFIGDIHVDYR